MVSFNIQVGKPPQSFTVLPATNGQNTYVPAADDCQRMSRSDCGYSRGVSLFEGRQSPGFQSNASTTWDLIGLYEIGVNRQLGYTGNGIAGFDTLGMATNSSHNITFPEKEVVTSYATPDLWVGELGLGIAKMTIRPNERVSPLLVRLQDSGVIPSVSFGYTAGAAYRKVPASLTIGGYDETRMSKAITIPIGDDQDRPLTVGLQSIVTTNSLNGTLNLLHQAILIPIDSSVSELWLPESVCDMFATAFGLQYQNASGRYTIADSKRSKLRELNPKVTFTIADGLVKGSSINLDFPYAAFDMEATYPIFANASPYFPIRRAANDSQYVLGRTFLQETYLGVDYDREHFNISQATFPTSPNTPHIVTILPSNYTSNSTNDSRTPFGSAGQLPTSVIVGIVAGVVTVVVLVAALLWFRRARRRSQTVEKMEATDAQDVFECPDRLMAELPAVYVVHEIDIQKNALVEVDGTPTTSRHELPEAGSRKNGLFELGSKPTVGVHELQ
jgi:hypothetical protein